MAQRLMVARWIVHRPPILFLDEPTAGLDPQSRLALWEILGGMNEEGQTILLTTHYMEEADRLCDRSRSWIAEALSARHAGCTQAVRGGRLDRVASVPAPKTSRDLRDLAGVTNVQRPTG